MRRIASRASGWAAGLLGLAVLGAPILIVIVVGRWVGREAEASRWPAFLRLGATYLVWPALIIVVFRLWFGGIARLWAWMLGALVRRYAAVAESALRIPGPGDGDRHPELLDVEEERRAVGAEA